MTDHDKLLEEELEKRLLWYREEASEEEFDVDEVDAICTILRKLSPAGETKKAYRNVMRRIRLEEKELKREKGYRGKSGFRAAAVFIAVAGILVSLNIVSYARENKSLFTIVFERVGWLEIEKNEAADGIGGDERLGGFYDSWADLEREVKKRITVPTHIPEGYSLYGIRYWEHDNRETLQADYYNQKNGHLHMEITLWKNNADQYRENAADENAYLLLPEYSDENTLFYMYGDEYICMIFAESSFYRVSGNIRLEEMVKIREGLGDVGQK